MQEARRRPRSCPCPRSRRADARVHAMKRRRFSTSNRMKLTRGLDARCRDRPRMYCSGSIRRSALSTRRWSRFARVSLSFFRVCSTGRAAEWKRCLLRAVNSSSGWRPCCRRVAKVCATRCGSSGMRSCRRICRPIKRIRWIYRHRRASHASTFDSPDQVPVASTSGPFFARGSKICRSTTVSSRSNVGSSRRCGCDFGKRNFWLATTAYRRLPQIRAEQSGSIL